MTLRRQLPVSSTIRPTALAEAVRPALTRASRTGELLTFELRRAFAARSIVLTDSGTSALVLALRIAARRTKTVALPAYGCIDLTAAALFADVRVRLYDLDPSTLGPDLDSLQRTLTRGVDAVVLAHLYGYPVDVPAAAALAARAGAAVIEDAAQGAWGSLRGTRLGAFGPLSVLSFGRGKGLSGGRGGALLSLAPRWDAEVDRAAAGVGPAPRGVRDLAVASVQWMLGRPMLYGIPSAIPMLRLGEMVYRPAHEPRALSAAAAALVRDALARAERDLGVRRRHAAALADALEAAPGARGITPISGASPGYLRFPVRVLDGRTLPAALGVLRAYPVTMYEQPELQSLLAEGETEQPGAVELRRSLVTLPTHRFVSLHDLHALREWLRAPGPPSAAAPLAMATPHA